MDDSPPRPKPTSFQRLVRWTCRLAWLALMGVLGFVLTGVLAGWMLARPPRRALQDYHRDYLDHPAAHGLLIHRAEVSIDGPPHPVPYLVCEPDVHAGPAARGTKLRDQLAAGGSVVPAYGFVRGNLVLLHGRKGRKEDLLPVAERFCAAGFRCLLPDLPAHGENMAPNCGYGTFVQEAEIPAAVLDDAARRFSFSADQPAGLWGISMGGSYALSAAKVDAKRWDRVIVVCSFARLYDVVQGQARHLAGPLGPRPTIDPRRTLTPETPLRPDLRREPR